MISDIWTERLATGSGLECPYERVRRCKPTTRENHCMIIIIIIITEVSQTTSLIKDGTESRAKDDMQKAEKEQVVVKNKKLILAGS